MPGASDRVDASPTSALEAKSDIAVQLKGRRAALLLDYDGTLTPIVAEPDQAPLPEDMRATLVALARQAAVAVISGRDLEDVSRIVGIKSFAYAGSHGFDMRLPGGGRVEHPRGADFLAALDAAEAELRERQRALPGLRVERKKYAVAAHYRRAQESEVPAIESAVDDVLRRHAQLRRSTGKRVFELRPAVDWHKGSAVLWLLDELGLPDALPIYIGDDDTDEDAFAALRDRGVTIAVQEEPQPTAAQYTLRDASEVRELLEWVLSVIE